MADNLRLWKQVEKTDPNFTKPFNRGGGFRGTAVNSTYLARRATEVFGPIGIGWGVEILDEALMEGAPLDDKGTRELIHKVRVKLWYKQGEMRGEVVQFGQTVFVGRNKFGLFTDEEAPKKSMTDAMSKCLSLLGFAADVHLGRYDDNKYLQALASEFREKPPAEGADLDPAVRGEMNEVVPALIQPAQVEELEALIGETHTDAVKLCRFFKVTTISELPAEHFERARSMLLKKRTKAA